MSLSKTKEDARAFISKVFNLQSTFLDLSDPLITGLDDSDIEMYISEMASFGEEWSDTFAKRFKDSFISGGNTKIGKMGSFSLMLGSTCPAEVNCRLVYKRSPESRGASLCYAMPLLRRAKKQVLLTYWRNYLISLHTEFVEKISKEIVDNKITLIRVSVSGDLYSQKYVDDWFAIAEKNPQTKFYTYTKFYDWNYDNKPGNFTLNYSVDILDTRSIIPWPEWADNMTEVIPSKEKHKLGQREVYCRAGQMTCAECKWCFQSNQLKILFAFHSSDPSLKVDIPEIWTGAKEHLHPLSILLEERKKKVRKGLAKGDKLMIEQWIKGNPLAKQSGTLDINELWTRLQDLDAIQQEIEDLEDSLIPQGSVIS